MQLRPTDLPEPVVPATSRCGIGARSAMTGSPAMFLPSTSGSEAPWSSNALLTDQFVQVDRSRAWHWAVRCRSRCAPGWSRRAPRSRDMLRAISSASWITRLALMPRRGLELVHRHDRAGPDLDDLALDVEIVEHAFEQPRIALQRGLVDRPRLVAGGAGLSRSSGGSCVVVARGRARSACALGLGAREGAIARSAITGPGRASGIATARGAARALRLGRQRLPARASRRARRSDRRGAAAGSRRAARSADVDRKLDAHRPQRRPAPDSADAARRSTASAIGLADEADRPVAAARRRASPTTPPQPAGSASTAPREDSASAVADQRDADERAAQHPPPAPDRHVAPQPRRDDQRRPAAAARPAGRTARSSRSANHAPGGPSQLRAGPPEAVLSEGSLRMIAGEREHASAAPQRTDRDRADQRAAARARRPSPSRATSGGCARLAIALSSKCSLSVRAESSRLRESRVKAAGVVRRTRWQALRRR